MVLLVIGDLHFQERDIELYTTFIDRLETNILQKKEYEAVILLGDIQHKFKIVDRAAQTLVCLLFKMITKYTNLYVLVGNHDYDNATQFLTENHTLMPFKTWPKVKIIDKPTKVILLEKNMLLCPYVPKGRFMEAVETHLKKEKPSLLFCHQEFLGSLMGPYPSLDGDIWPEMYPMVISGHAHGRHQVGKNIQYVGMPYDDSYDETHKRYILELDNSLKFIWLNSLKMPRKMQTTLTIEEAMEWQPKKNTSYRLKIVCSGEEYKQFLKTRKKVLQPFVAKFIHVSTDQKKLQEALQKRREEAGTCDKYETIFHNLVQKENKNLVSLFKKILEN